MVVKVYISGISGNKEVKKRQQRVLMILESKSIPFEVIDITEPGKEAEKDFMQTNSTSLGGTISDTTPRHPLPPQIFTDKEYCGDYDQFDMANEIDTLEQFLKIEAPIPADNTTNGTTKVNNVADAIIENVESVVEQIERNGISSSREASVEAESKPVEDEPKPNGVEESDVAEDTKEKDEEDEGLEEDEDEEASKNISKEVSPSEDLINSEKAAAD